VIFLTFDDGPDPVWTPQILRVLTENDATATFFDIGENVVGRTALVSRIRSQGSQVGNHTWDHPSLPALTDAAITSQLDRTDRVQGRARCVRPPYGATTHRVDALIRARGQRVELWNVDTRDWARPGVAAIEHELLTARAGSTVLMHTGGGDRSETVAALRDALPKLRAAGFVLQGIPGC
jgi:Predicted xylanase/chitin deacetylase